MRGFGDLEAEIMDRLWDRAAAATVRQVVDELQRDLAYTTVMTVMDNLHTKGVLSRQRDGRAYRYRPVLTREEYTAQLMRQALDDSRDRVSVFVHFLHGMTADDAKALEDAYRQVTGEDAP